MAAALIAVVIAVCGLLYGTTFRTQTIVIFGILVPMFLQTFEPLLCSYTAECSPTQIRNSGMGLTYGIGRLANVSIQKGKVFLPTHCLHVAARRPHHWRLRSAYEGTGPTLEMLLEVSFVSSVFEIPLPQAGKIHGFL